MANDWFSSQKLVSCSWTRAITGQHQSRKVVTLLPRPRHDPLSLPAAHLVHLLSRPAAAILCLAPGLPGHDPEQPHLTGFDPTHASGLRPVHPLPLPLGPPGHASAYPRVAAPLQPVPRAAARQTALRHCLEILGPCGMPALQRGLLRSGARHQTTSKPETCRGISAVHQHFIGSWRPQHQDPSLPPSVNPDMLVQPNPWPSPSRKLTFFPILWLCQILS